MSLHFDLHDLADRLRDALQLAEDQFRMEQAVYGLDSLDEVKVHQLLVRGLSRSYTIQREVHYPTSVGKRKSARQRCDLVLTPHGRPLKPEGEPDLFTPPDAVPPELALWLEVKLAAQFRDASTRNTAYGSQWRNGIVDDLKKMEADPRIHEAGLLLLAFTESEEIFAADLQALEALLVTSGVIAGFRHVRTIRLTERMGHRFLSLALWPTVQRGQLA
jgi:hypothetical protein